MASADLEEDLKCPICLNIYTNPVNLACGHNYCRDCIGKALDVWDVSGVYTCPECKKTFTERPVLQRNIALCNITERFKSAQLAQEETGIICAYCIHYPVPAVKSCLMCEASLCDKHLRVHSKSAEHVLTDPTTDPENRKCSVHKRIMEYYCTEDAACICVFCRLDGDHVGHQVESLKDAADKKMEKLRNVLEKLSSKREETEKRVQRLQERGRQIQEKGAGVTERVTALVRDIGRQLEDLEKEVLSEISSQQEQVSLRISELIQQLEIKKDDLYSKMSHIEELCNMTDPVSVLQERESDSGDFWDVEDGDEDRKRYDKQVHDIGDLDDGLISELFLTRLADIVTGVKSGTCVQDVGIRNILYMQGASDILLDESTAGNNIDISGNSKMMIWTKNNLNRPQTPERFQCNQVLSLQIFSTGQHHWEVESSKSGDWRIGVSYSSASRKGEKSRIGNNNKSWCLRRGCNQYSVWHNGINTPLPNKAMSYRLRICLDYEAGRLSFYELCDSISHLHTFTAAFTEPLQAAFYIWGDMDGRTCRLRIGT